MSLKFVAILLFATQILANPISVDKSVGSFDDPEVISCTFQEPIPPSVYTCFLLLQNPLGLNNFTTVPGNHVAGFTNDDVQQVFAVYQSSRNIPSVICEAFPNVLDIIIEMSEIQEVHADTFVSCVNLEFLMIGVNHINVIPDGLFRANANLQVILMNNNRITEIAANAFAGSGAVYIDIGSNQLRTYNQAWMTPVSETLEILLINRNQFVYFPSFSPFADLGNLRELDLSLNPLSSVHDYTFRGLTSLERLFISDLSLETVNRNWFMDLGSLTHLYMGYNRIRELRAGDLSSLKSLIELNVNNNDLTFIDAEGFGQSLITLRNLHATRNRIVGIDESFLEQSSSLRWLMLDGNRCFGTNIYNVDEDRDAVREELSECFTNFVGFARCSMFDMQPYPYECVLTVMNPTGRDLESIEVTHGEGRSDGDVATVEALFQHTRNFPSVICRQFANVSFIMIQESEIEIINENSFVDCANLWQLNLAYNKISAIPDGTFAHTPQLRRFDAFVNRISNIGRMAFAGSALREIALERNSLSVFDPETFWPVAETLGDLFLNENAIMEIPPDAFSRLSRLRWIDLSGNRIPVIPSNAFRFLTNLEHLELMGLGLNEIDPMWFADLTSLFDLRLDSNNFHTIPAGAFDNLRALTTLTIGNNRLRNLHANSFGASLNTLVFLLAGGNTIRAIDSDIVNAAPSLQWLHLTNNVCSGVNFYQVQNDIEEVREQLAECFRMFDGFMECTYEDFFAYTCRLTIQNVAPRNDWVEVPGQHVDGLGNSDVLVVSANAQDTANVPSVLCRQFGGLLTMEITRSFVFFIDEEMFEDCTSLETLVLASNYIGEIPDFTFVNSPHLSALELHANRISNIGPNAFVNLRFAFLELDRNFLTEFNPQWVASSHETLLFLLINNNRISELPADAFAGLNGVFSLDVGENPLRSIPPTAFDGLSNLRELGLEESGLIDVDPRWFRNLESLEFLFLYDNQITELRTGTFANLPSLTEIDLGINHITTIPADAFGDGLVYLYVDFNHINEFDPTLFENSPQLRTVYASDNLCVNLNFFTRDSALDGLSSCIENFNAPGSIECLFVEYPLPGDYSCVVAIRNPNGLEFEAISGEHVSGFGNEQVQKVEAAYQNTRNIPAIICDDFPSMTSLAIQRSRIQRVTAAAFRNCRNLWKLALNNNEIASVEAGVFDGLTMLGDLNLEANRIHHLATNLFADTVLYRLWLGANQIAEVNGAHFSGVETTLKELFLFENRLSEIGEDVFTPLQALEVLDVGLNPGMRVAAGAFKSMGGLRMLSLDNSELGSVDAGWFEDLESLTDVFIHNNRFTFLPPGLFAPLTNLNEVTIGGNPFESLNSNIFGENLANLRRISVINSGIQAIDERILDVAGETLSSLYLVQNECVNQNFFDVSNNLDEVRAALEPCFAAFRGSIECHFVDFADTYTCLLLVQNIAGHDNFADIPGDHGELTNDDVTLVESLMQNTRTIPSVICTQFTNLREIFIEESRIRWITVSECRQLERLTLGYNDIESIEAETFVNNENLVFLDLRMNRITRIAEDAFAGSALINLDLSSNHLSTFDPAWVSSIVGTLSSLELYENGISSLNADTFTTLTNLRVLDLGLNPNIDLPSDLFQPLTNLEELFIDSSSIRRVDSQWFESLASLTVLHLHSNKLRSLPRGTFVSLNNLAYLSVRNNRLTTVNGDAFSSQLGNFTRFYAQSNAINKIDGEFFDRVSGQLEMLFLYDNVCVSMNFYDVNQNQALVREDLQRCIENFGEN